VEGGGEGAGLVARGWGVDDLCSSAAPLLEIPDECMYAGARGCQGG
jgi:hypothetical protein